MLSGLGLTCLGFLGFGVPTAAVPLTLLPTWVGIGAVCYGSEQPSHTFGCPPSICR